MTVGGISVALRGYVVVGAFVVQLSDRFPLGESAEGLVEFEDVDVGGTEESELGAVHVSGDEIADPGRVETAGGSDRVHLGVGSRRADVWIYAAAGRSDQIWGRRDALLLELIDALVVSVQQFLGPWAQV